MKALRISQDLALPIDAATQTILIVGKRGSGKSTTAARAVEQLLKAKVPVAILDPVDSWWGLKASRDGAGQGHSVYVFGGRHADLPLEAGAGALIAEFLCEHRAPVVLSCKHMSGLERSRFMVDFALTLFRKWTGGVLHLVLEEAHELAPQAPPKGEKAEEMLGAFKRLWKLGRSSGIGGTAITQRPASLHKDITTQSEILVVHRTIGPQDVEAVRQWIKYHHQGEEILPHLATLKTGEAFVWAPEFPEDAPIGLRRVQVLPRETFDSSSTPKHGEQRTEPSELAAVDLERLRSKMAATIERAKSEDPRELRKKVAEQATRIRALENTVATGKVVGVAMSKVRIIEKQVLKDAQVKRLEVSVERLLGEMARVADMLAQRQQVVVGEAGLLRTALEAAVAARDPQAMLGSGGRPGLMPSAPRFVGEGRPAAPSRPAPVVSRAPVAARRPVSTDNGSGDLGKGERATLVAAAQYTDAGGATREQLSILTGYKRSSRDAYLARLRAGGYIDQNGESIVATDAGFKALGADFEPLPFGDALQEHWLRRLPEGERRVLNAVIAAYPRPVARDTIDAAVGYKRSSRDAYISRLAARKLVRPVGRGEVRAADELFG